MAILVLIAGSFLVLLPDWKFLYELDPANPYVPGTDTTEVITVVGGTGDLPKKTTTETPQGPSSGPASVVTEDAGRRTETTETSSPASDSTFERAIAGGGLFFLRLGLVVLAAFLAGAVVQRVWLGSYGIKIGVLELGDVPEAVEASTEAVKKLENWIVEQIEPISDAVTALQSEVKEIQDLLTQPDRVDEVIGELINATQLVTDRLIVVEGKLAALEGR